MNGLTKKELIHNMQDFRGEPVVNNVTELELEELDKELEKIEDEIDEMIIYSEITDMIEDIFSDNLISNNLYTMPKIKTQFKTLKELRDALVKEFKKLGVPIKFYIHQVIWYSEIDRIKEDEIPTIEIGLYDELEEIIKELMRESGIAYNISRKNPVDVYFFYKSLVDYHLNKPEIPAVEQELII